MALALLRATARALPWRPQFAAAGLALVLAADAARHAPQPSAAFDAQVAAVLLAAAIVVCAADRLGAAAAAVPVALWRRRAAAGAICAVIPCICWPIVLIGGSFSPAAAGVLTLQFLAITTAGLAVGQALPGQEAAVAAGLALALGMARLMPAGETGRAIVAAAPTDAAALAWATLSVVTATALVRSHRDPARRRRTIAALLAREVRWAHLTEDR